jgi:hypothetical protein
LKLKCHYLRLEWVVGLGAAMNLRYKPARPRSDEMKLRSTRDTVVIEKK